MNNICKKWLGYVGVILFTIHCSLFTVSCSEDSEEDSEYADWQARNEATTDSWAANSSYRKIRTYTQDDTSTGANSAYIYVEVLESGDGTESPIFTDTCRVAYRGRLIPTTNYKEGYVFDQSFLNDFDKTTAGTADYAASGVVVGFSTALMNMHAGDRWRVYIPYQLGYGTTSSGAIPAYSNLIFDIALYDFWRPGESRPSFNARQR
ncbi:MAG: FKBP-type peptidyl-prolyl cis-trans isomerase [Prevotella sp.]|nr:FKBP-type peptidyl-prolyl cis-trans isomerase [Prevotella sp.]